MSPRLDDFGTVPSRVALDDFESPGLVACLLAEAMDQEPDEPDWIWEGYLAAGWISLLAGLPKTGKTTLVCGLLDAMRAGTPFLGRAICACGALVLTEQPPSVYKATLTNYGLDFDRERVHAAFYRRQRTFAWDELIAGAVDVCRAEGLGLLVVDTWARWASMRADHDATEILRALAPLGRAAEAGIGVLIVHHARKDGGAHGTEVSGRVEIVAAVDVVMSLARFGEGRRILAEGRSTSTPLELGYALDPVSGFELLGDAAGLNAHKVEKALSELGEATYAEIARGSGLSRSAVQRNLDWLLEQGRVEDAGKRGHARLFRRRPS